MQPVYEINYCLAFSWVFSLTGQGAEVSPAGAVIFLYTLVNWRLPANGKISTGQGAEVIQEDGMGC